MIVGKHKNPENCGICGGKGKVVVNNDNKEQEVTCPSCNGSGKA
ncbi:hypothetical protein [Actinomadura vinacea]